MTLRSDRRKAELAVIEAAREARASNLDLNTVDALYRAVKDLDALPLVEPGRAQVNQPAMLTAELARDYMNGKRARTVIGRILEVLVYRGGRTCDELEVILGRPHQTVSPRVNELRDLGWIVDTHKTRRTRSGQDAVVWALSPQARLVLVSEITKG